MAAAREDAPFVQWLKLEVIRSETQGDTGVVEFKAYYQYRGQSSILHEISQFKSLNIQEDSFQGEWNYTISPQVV